LASGNSPVAIFSMGKGVSAVRVQTESNYWHMQQHIQEAKLITDIPFQSSRISQRNNKLACMQANDQLNALGTEILL